MTQNANSISRRTFVKFGAAAIVAPTIVPAASLGYAGKVAPSDRITLGIVGLGSRGFNLLNDFLSLEDAQVIAVCDVDDLHYRDHAWGSGKTFGRQAAKETIAKHDATNKSGAPARGLMVSADFRELSARQDLDAIVVATPDHWHALCTLHALRSGKDVYCEKPITHTFREGQQVVLEVEKQQAIFQTGSQQRSDQRFRDVVDLVHNGHLGKVQRVEVGLPPGYAEPMGSTDETVPPKQLDYDFWCGPAPMLPYMRARHHRWWRGHRAFGGGVLMDWIGHHNDIAHWALGMDRSGPLTVEAVGWTFPETDVYNTPHHYEIKCDYPGGIHTSISDSHPIGTRLIGDQGWIHVARGTTEASEPRWLAADFDPGSSRAYVSPGHTRNFLDSIKSRQACVAPAETAHRSITPGHLGYVSQSVGRQLGWNAAEQRIEGDAEANELLNDLVYRQPWR